jgi:hypothetical protein
MEKRDHDAGDTVPSCTAVGRLSDGDGVILHTLDQDRIKLLQLFNVLPVESFSHMVYSSEAP